MDIQSSDFIVDTPMVLNTRKTFLETGMSNRKVLNKLNKARAKLSDLQEKIYAHNRYSVLICLQGMDTAGKDSLIREVSKEFSPIGTEVHSFKSPTTTELGHDYLWRHYIALPQRGVFGIFNRSHYENVLITRVRPEIILKERIPGIESIHDITPAFWEQRFEQINNFEKHISSNGMVVLKFFLHLSKEEQRNRILRRLNKESHTWKFEPADVDEREYWDLYQTYYEEAINKTSTITCPWFVIPADDKNVARLIVTRIILQELEKLTDVKLPDIKPVVKEKLSFYIDTLQAE